MKKFVLTVLFFVALLVLSISCKQSCKCYYQDTMLIDYEGLMDKSSCKEMNADLDQKTEYCHWE